MTLCERSVKASKKLVGTLAKSAKKGKFSLQKTFTQSEMKEILSSKSNDNFWMNDNGIYMSRGKVVNGESVGVGRVSSIYSEDNYRGGSYGGIKVKTKPHNIERHHIPPDSVTDISKKKGMSIQMEKEDHRGTSSWGPSKEAKKYRENLQSMISEGKVRDAVATDIWDVKNVTGSKYNTALQEMLKYGKKEGIIPPKGKK